MDPLDGDKWLREAVIVSKCEKRWTPKIKMKIVELSS